jgi:hypothetical protein
MNFQPSLGLNKIEFEKAVDKTTTALINEVLLKSDYEGVQDTVGFAAFKNEWIHKNITLCHWKTKFFSRQKSETSSGRKYLLRDWLFGNRKK